MQIFYTTQISGQQIILIGDEYNHCKNVLRMKPGEEVQIADGKGNFYTAKIQNFLKDKAELSILNHHSEVSITNYSLHVIIAPTKNIDRMEWFVEKAVEIGISEISFILTKRSERKLVNIERLEKIAVSAMKQSGKAWLPKLNDLQPFEKFIKNQPKERVKFVAHLIEGKERQELKEMISKVGKQNSKFDLLIGPEGDFMPDEVEMAIKNGYLPVSLGNSRLRTETAGVMGCAVFSVVLN